jgi:hypothetical protein
MTEMQHDDIVKKRVTVKRKLFKVTTSAPLVSILREVRELFEQYAAEVEQSDLSSSSKTMYIDFADCFVRWMNGGFRPGLYPRGKRRTNLVR